MKRPFGLVVLLCLVGIATPASADDVTNAEELFRRAKALMSANKHVDACPLLEESYRLEKAMGTLLNLALCHEQIGKIASAWGEFRAVEQQARASTPPREDRAKLAREHADKLEPRLSRVRILVPTEARAPGLLIKIDGDTKGEALWATGITVDPGSHVIEASAPNKKPSSTKIKIDDEGAVQLVKLRPLDDLPVAAAATPRGPDIKEMEQYASNRARRTTGFVVGGIGLASLAVGVGFGVGAILNNSDAKGCSPCAAGSPEASASNQATDRALVFANIANVTVPIGVLGSVLGAYLVFTAGATDKVAVVPRASAQAGGLDLVGRW